MTGPVMTTTIKLGHRTVQLRDGTPVLVHYQRGNFRRTTWCPGRPAGKVTLAVIKRAVEIYLTERGAHT